VSVWSFASAPFLIAGPCAVEAVDVMDRVAEALARLAERHRLPVCFKASFDKANRARLDGARGPGLEAGLRALEHVRAAHGLPVLTDIHESSQAVPAAEVVDALQVPAFLCRQTDLLRAAGACGKPVNVKKGQWMDADGMRGALAKVRAGGCSDLAVTERGTFFGYGDLVGDCAKRPVRRSCSMPATACSNRAAGTPARAAVAASTFRRCSPRPPSRAPTAFFWRRIPIRMPRRATRPPNGPWNGSSH